MRVLIATLHYPPRDKVQEFNDTLRAEALEFKVTIPAGIVWADGPGCANLAFRMLGAEEDQETFARATALALMPSKWCECKDRTPDEDEYRMTIKET